MNAKEAKKIKNAVLKDMKAKPSKPGDLLLNKKRPSKKILGVLGLI